MSELAITKRTFGIEWELADVVRASVEMPDGFVWDKDEIVQNTDMSEGRKTVPIGGELNTDPMHLCHKDFARLKQFIDSARQNGAQAIRDLASQVHIYIGDLTVDEVKNIFYLSYYTSGLLKEICHTPEYSDLQIYRPSPTLEKYVGVKGDVNRDGNVDISDVVALVNIILNSSSDYQAEADLNNDGDIDISDVVALVNIILGQ